MLTRRPVTVDVVYEGDRCGETCPFLRDESQDIGEAYACSRFGPLDYTREYAPNQRRVIRDQKCIAEDATAYQAVDPIRNPCQ